MPAPCVFCGKAVDDEDKPLCPECWYPAGISIRCDSCGAQFKGGRELAQRMCEYLCDTLHRHTGVACFVSSCPSCKPLLVMPGFFMPFYIPLKFLPN